MGNIFKELEKLSDAWIEKEKAIAKAEIEEVVKLAGDIATKELTEEAINMYDSLIEQYYTYKTKSYYRHHAGVGTGWGENLYAGKNIFQEGERGINIEFSGSEMEKYISKYSGQERVSRDEVLNIVKAGFRGVPGKWIVPWSGSYDGKYFSVSNTNINQAFDLFIKNYGNIYKSATKEHIGKIVKRKKYKYVR